jgi:hypothetical protein
VVLFTHIVEADPGSTDVSLLHDLSDSGSLLLVGVSEDGILGGAEFLGFITSHFVSRDVEHLSLNSEVLVSVSSRALLTDIGEGVRATKIVPLAAAIHLSTVFTTAPVVGLAPRPVGVGGCLAISPHEPVFFSVVVETDPEAVQASAGRVSSDSSIVSGGGGGEAASPLFARLLGVTLSSIRVDSLEGRLSNGLFGISVSG